MLRSGVFFLLPHPVDEWQPAVCCSLCGVSTVHGWVLTVKSVICVRALYCVHVLHVMCLL